MTLLSTKTIVFAGLVALLGAGCPQTAAVPKKTVQTPPTQKIAAARGFGNLPSPGESAQDQGGNGAPQAGATSLAPSAPMPAGVSAPDKMAAYVGESSIRFPIPPPPQKPVVVTYNLEATMPTWPAEDKVFRFSNTTYPASSLAMLAAATGLPSQALGTNAELQSFNFSWSDAEKFQWNYDAGNRNVSFWKQSDAYPVIMEGDTADKTLPTIDEPDMVAIADGFLSRHGFGAIARSPGTVEKPWGDVVMKGMESYPCPVMMDTVKVVPMADPASGAGVSGSAGASMIAPCWYPMNQVTVVYTAMREGKNVNDISGWPFRNITITINVKDKQIVGGNVWLDRDAESSVYPLIGNEEALKRLKAGGRNPIWPWYEGGDITVHLKTVELVWMRYDVWTDNKNEVYLIPALAASGTAEYSKDNIQPYRTIVPLVADDAFEPVKPPEPVPLPAVRAVPPVEVMPAPAPKPY